MIDVESVVFTRVYNDFSDTLKTEYNLDIDNFSTEGQLETDAVFPFVYIHLLPATEQDGTLEGTTIEGGLFTVQIEVSDNADQERMSKIMNEVIRVMKSMRFQVNQMPEFSYTSSVYRKISRFKRVIGSDDTL